MVAFFENEECGLVLGLGADKHKFESLLCRGPWVSDLLEAKCTSLSCCEEGMEEGREQCCKLLLFTMGGGKQGINQ